MKQYLVTKDIYHKGKLIKEGSIVASDTDHKYFEPYQKPEFSNEKEPPTMVLDNPQDSEVQYDENGIVKTSQEGKKNLNSLDKKIAEDSTSSTRKQPTAKSKTTNKSKVADLAQEDEVGDVVNKDKGTNDDAF